MTWGIKISEPGVDVKTAADEDLVVNSAYFSVKEITDPSGIPTTLSVDNGDLNGSISYNHGLSYPPAYMVFIEDRDGEFFKLPGRSDDTAVGSEGPLVGTVRVDSTKIEVFAGFQGDFSPDDYEFQLRIFLFEDEGL